MALGRLLFSVKRLQTRNLTDPMVNGNDVKIGKLELLVQHCCYRRTTVQPTHFMLLITGSVQEIKLNWLLEKFPHLSYMNDMPSFRLRGPR